MTKQLIKCFAHQIAVPESKVYGANMGPTWVLSAPDGLHAGSMNLGIKDVMSLIHNRLLRGWSRPVY